jgi:hypothetical protein
MQGIAKIFTLIGGLALAMPNVACTADIHDNPVDIDGEINIDEANVEIGTDADVDNIPQGSPVPVNVEVENMILVDPNGTPAPGEEAGAGHLVFFLDAAGTPLLVTAQTSVSITIGADVPEGPHRIVCQVTKHDGTPTGATAEIEINVTASVTTDG